MASVQIQSIIEHLDYGMKRALEAAVEHALPGIHVDRAELYREFRRAVGRKCSGWETVPDHYVEKPCPRCGGEP